MCDCSYVAEHYQGNQVSGAPAFRSEGRGPVAPPLDGGDSARVVGKPEVMARIGSAGITSGFPVTRPGP
jgi:hypothetical protein